MIGSRFGKLVLPFALLASVLVLIGSSNEPADANFPGTNDKVVYERGGDIWVMDADGSDQTLLYDGDESVERSPAWSPDGSKIAFSSDLDTGLGDGPNIWVMNADGSAPSQVTTSGFDDFQPAWSPDGTYLAFERNVGFTLGPWTASTGTTTTVIVDTAPTHGYDDYGVKAGMSVTAEGATRSIASVDYGANSLTLSAAITGLAAGDAYTISGDRYEIWAIDATTTGTGTNLSSQIPAGGLTVYSDYAPAWSPKGDMLAFTTGRNFPGSSDDVYTATVTGTTVSTPSNLTGGTWVDLSWEPDWSPDATQLVFQSQRDDTAAAPDSQGFENIFVMSSASGAGKTQLTDTTKVDRSPTWSPDGTTIMFMRDQGVPFVPDDEDLWTVPAVGGTAANITLTGAANEAQPNWGRMLKATPDTYAVAVGGTLNIPAPGVMANDTGLGGISFVTATVTKNPTHAAGGSFVFNPDGSFTYTHDGTENDDFFEYKVTDAGGNDSNVVRVDLDTPFNAAPIAVDDKYEVGRGETLNVAAPGVLTNDSDVEDGKPGTAVKVTDPSSGTLTLNADGSFSYTHNGSKGTTDSFTYQAQDSGGKKSNVATVTLQVSGDVHTIGLVDPAQGKWYLYNEAGVQQTTFFYGNPGDFPIYGDWDCDGIETPGMYRQSDGFVYLRNSNTQGIGDIRFFFGNPGDVPLAGDFNADGCDTVSIYRASEQRFYIINKLGENEGGLGAAEFSYVFGNPGDKPFVGDFDGDGVETVGLHRESTGLVYFRNSHTQGVADNQFIFGDPNDRLVAGDWTGNNVFSPALFRPSNTTMYFRYTNTQGVADASWVGGQSAWLPVSGYNGLG